MRGPILPAWREPAARAFFELVVAGQGVTRAGKAAGLNQPLVAVIVEESC